MVELIRNLADTPLPQIFIIAGIFFLVISVVNKFGGKLDINPKRQGQAIVIGIILIIVGLVIYVQPFKQITPVPIPPKTECELSVYSISQDEIIYQNCELCKVHISKGIPSHDVVDQEIVNTKFSVSVNNSELEAISEITPAQDENGGWHLNQFFEFRLCVPGKEYKVEGKTLEINGQLIDSRVFYILRE